MMRTLPAVLLVLATLSVSAQPRSTIDYRPVTCIRSAELPVLQMNITGKGEIRAYFRQINTTDWCSVEGENKGPLSRVVLPKFSTGDEVEYFFVLLEGRRVMARSPRIYRARVTNECERPFARHIFPLELACGQDAQAIPNAFTGGYALATNDDPCVVSPDSPDDVPCTDPPTQ